MIRGFAMLGAIAGAMMCSYQAAALEQRMIGAWIQSAADCAATFERRGGEIRFRRPVDEFRTAFIVKANGITTTSGQCSIVRTSSEKGATTVVMNCNNSIGYYERQAKLAVQGDTLTYGFPGNDSLDVRFEKCPL